MGDACAHGCEQPKYSRDAPKRSAGDPRQRAARERDSAISTREPPWLRISSMIDEEIFRDNHL